MYQSRTAHAGASSGSCASAASGRSSRSGRGYTLIELLMIVALLGLAGSLLIPYMVGRTSLETQSVVRMIVADLHFAQHDALAHQEYRRVHFFEDGSGYALIRVASLDESFDPDTADYLYHPASPGATLDRYLVDLSSDDRFSDVAITTADFDSGNRFITYDEMGGTVAPNGEPGGFGTITVTSPEATYHIYVSPFTGKLTVDRED